MTITTINYTNDPLISVYSDDRHIGMVYPPIKGRSEKFEAVRNDLTKAVFDSEADAIAFVSA